MDTKIIWNQLESFHSAETIQRLLEKKYKTDPQKKAYKNGYTFIYYLKHAESFYHQADHAPLSIQPIMYFYGMTQLLKACILTEDADYPNTSAVLAHGVTTRKRKKQNYEFLKDEVKIQRNGLFAHTALKMFHMKHLENDKYTMGQLLKKIPEMEETFLIHRQEKIHYEVKLKDNMVKIPGELTDLYHMTASRLKEYLITQDPYLQPANHDDTSVFLDGNSQSLKRPYLSSLFMYNTTNNSFALPTARTDIILLPETLVHYLLMYNLSMISRYETEWWYDLLLSHSNDDFIFISRFLKISSYKIPYYIWLFLNDTLINN
ncbi:YaaC family protein [Metabacillus arenae]|uniref:YaaC family protein n=1 Tax=Metabacillus arenae TaxID=2771434 RepID=A0A926S0N9_9BACI|nr:YaaC family protein [Metabacillus arenae]MBD1383492.1 YaaC family protein [Metabacillus arenae]